MDFLDDREAVVMDGNGTFGIVVMDDAAMARSGLTGTETFPYKAAWILHGEYREAPPAAPLSSSG